METGNNQEPATECILVDGSSQYAELAEAKKEIEELNGKIQSLTIQNNTLWDEIKALRVENKALAVKEQKALIEKNDIVLKAKKDAENAAKEAAEKAAKTITTTLKFSLEHVLNGFVLSYFIKRKDSDPLELTKEVVVEKDIYNRIGQLLQLEQFKKSIPYVFLVEMVQEKIYEFRRPCTDLSLINKLHYARVNKSNPEKILGLLIDGDHIEVIGNDALVVEKVLNVKASIVNGIPFYAFEPGPDGNKEFAKLPNYEVLTTTTERIQEWANDHPIVEIDPSAEQKISNQQKEAEKK